jgi:hypothetical protein
VVLASALGALWTLWEQHQQDPWLRLLQRAQARMQKAGLTVPSDLAQPSPRQLASTLQQHPDLRDWLLRLEALRYAPSSGLSLATLEREFKQLSWPP